MHLIQGSVESGDTTGTYYISLRAYSTFSGVSLVGNYQSN